jgi:hypothetical protein
MLKGVSVVTNLFGVLEPEHYFLLQVSCGDLNGDKIADLAIGSPYSSGSMIKEEEFGAGEVHIVFGKEGTWNRTFDTSYLNGNNGFKIYGTSTGDRFGWSLAVGDVNGDTFGDIIIGAPYGNGGAEGPGYVAAVFGKTSFAESAVIQLMPRTTPSEDYVIILGNYKGGAAGVSVAAGDINDDGREDIIIGANLCSRPLQDSMSAVGCAYIYFGKSGKGNSWAPNSHELIEDNSGNEGIAVYGTNQETGSAIAIGDINGDGIPDILMDENDKPDLGAEGPARPSLVYVVFAPKVFCSSLCTNINFTGICSILLVTSI